MVSVPEPEYEADFAAWTESLVVDEELRKKSIEWAEREASGQPMPVSSGSLEERIAGCGS